MYGDRRVHSNPVGGVSNAREGYSVFHSGQSLSQRKVEVPDPPSELYVIGRLINLTYLPYKSSKKHHEQYIHEFGDTGYTHDTDPTHAPLLAADEKGNLFVIRDQSKYYINSRGIVG